MKKANKSKANKKVPFTAKQTRLIAIVAVLTLVTISFAGYSFYQKNNSVEAGSCTSYNYRYGSRGTCVKNIQYMLNGITSIFSGKSKNGTTLSSTILSTDGIFGSGTNTKVKNFQKWYGTTADGIVGPKTWRGLCAYAGDSEYVSAYGTHAWVRSAYTSSQLAGC